MKYYDHTGTAPFRAVAASVDVDLIQRRHRLSWRLHAEHLRMDRERRAKADAVIVAEREARIEAQRVHARVKAMVEP